MDGPLRTLFAAALVLLAVLMLNCTYLQGFRAGALRGDPLNNRHILDQYKYDRGPITAGGRQLAYSRDTGRRTLRYLRVYPQGPEYAPITGYMSLYTSTGLERTESGMLNGTDERLTVNNWLDAITGKPLRGATVETTVRPEVQDAAYEELRKRSGKVGRGAAIALDPHSGAILAMASVPSYDPNSIATHDLGAAGRSLAALTEDAGQPLLNRAIARTYPPGSTFKVIGASAALASGRYRPDSNLHAPDQLPLPDTTISLHNAGGESCGGTATLAASLEMSCNTSFAWLALRLGPRALREEAREYGFGRRLHLPLTTAASVYPRRLDRPQTALSGIGQGDVRATPLQMAMVAAAVGNEGVVMRPYLVSQVLARNQNVVKEAGRHRLSERVTAGTARDLKRMMEQVVYGSRGTARGVPRIPGVRMAGKTGTAQWREGAPPHAWFIGFAPVDDPKVAVAVIIEAGGSAGPEAYGATVAAPVAVAMMRAALHR